MLLPLPFINWCAHNLLAEFKCTPDIRYTWVYTASTQSHCHVIHVYEWIWILGPQCNRTRFLVGVILQFSVMLRCVNFLSSRLPACLLSWISKLLLVNCLQRCDLSKFYWIILLWLSLRTTVDEQTLEQRMIELLKMFNGMKDDLETPMFCLFVLALQGKVLKWWTGVLHSLYQCLTKPEKLWCLMKKGRPQRTSNDGECLVLLFWMKLFWFLW